MRCISGLCAIFCKLSSDRVTQSPGHSIFSFLAIVLALALTPSCRQTTSDDTLFENLNPKKTGVAFANQLAETEDWNIIEYLYFYNGGGVAAGDINNDGLPDLYFTANQLPNRLYLNLGNFQFADITEKAGVAGSGMWKTGVSMADVNGDGWLDIYVCQVGEYKMISGRNELFINNRDGTFTEQAEAYGLAFKGFSQHAAFFDFDRDGDLDLYLLNHSVHAAENYGPSSGRLLRNELAGDRLYRNDDNTFVDISEQAGIYGSRLGFGLSVALADFDGNGCTDIFVANDFHENDYLYYNQCDGTFREGLAQSMGHTSAFTMGTASADLNNDGWTDLVSLDMKPWQEPVLKRSVGADPHDIFELKRGFGYHFQYPRNMLQINQGPLGDRGTVFRETGQMAGIDATDWSWSVLAADLDLDGWKDLFISNGIWRRPNDLDYLKFTSNENIQQNASNLELASHMPSGEVSKRAFRNIAGQRFEENSGPWGLGQKGSSQGSAYADLDADGDLDLIVNNLNAPASIFRNHARERNVGNSIRIRLEGEGRNRFGIGTRATIWSDSLVRTEELHTCQGWLSSVEPLLIVGIGKRERIDSIRVIWPDGRWEQRTGVEMGPDLIFRQMEAGIGPIPLVKNPSPLLNENPKLLAGTWVHRENPSFEFNREKLLLAGLSAEGPAFAAADLNLDGTDDFFSGGAAGQSGCLWLSSPSRAWFPADTSFLIPSIAREDTDAVFFDADGDGDPDLAVANGGYLPQKNGPNSGGRLYRNEGQGRFSAEEHLPLVEANISCLVPLDFDGDGDLDLFAGGRARTGQYGSPVDSYLWENDGQGRFKDVTGSKAGFLRKLGMVTDACWLEKEKMLAIVGEWMPLTLVSWRGNTADVRKSAEKGWWRRIRAADLDGNGKTDLLLGNEGLNHPFTLQKGEKVEMFIWDIDQNGSLDPLLTYYRNGVRSLFHDKDELSQQWVEIKKRYVSYAPFSEATPEEVLKGMEWERAMHLEADFLSSAIYWDADPQQAPVPLPLEAQVAPVWDFAIRDHDGDGLLDIYLAGNTWLKAPKVGRADASCGLVLRQTAPRRFLALEPRVSGFIAPGESRRLEFLSMKGVSSFLVLARNNDELMIWETAR